MDRIAALLEEASGGAVDFASLIDGNPYLKNEKLREWMGLIMLRPMSRLSPFQFGDWYFRLLRDIVDKDRINALFAQERRKNPALDAWLSRRDVSTYTIADLATYPKDSFGGLFHRYLCENNMDLDLGVAAVQLETDFDYWVIRGLQNHDLEHLLCGGGFNIIGEMVPISMRWASLFQHLDPELAGLLNVPTHLLFLSYLSSTMLHSPAAFPTLFDRMQRGWLIGRTSGPYFMTRLEDVFHLPLGEVRRRLDVNNVDDLDTRPMSNLVMHPPLAAGQGPR